MKKLTILLGRLSMGTIAMFMVLVLGGCMPEDGNISPMAGKELDVATLDVKPAEYAKSSCTALEYVSCTDADIALSSPDEIDLSQVGQKSVTIEMKKGFFTRKEQVEINVVDTTPPVIELKQKTLNVEMGAAVDLDACVGSVIDPVDGAFNVVAKKPDAKGSKVGKENFYDLGWYMIDGKVDTNKAATYNPKVIAEDMHGNESEAVITVNVTDPLDGVQLTPKTEVLEYSTKETDPVTLVNCSVEGAEVKAAKLALSKVGKNEVTYTVTKGKSTKNVGVAFEVRDTKKPVIKIKSKENTVEWGASFDPYSVVESVKDEVDGDLARVESEPKENGNGWYTITGGFDTNVSKNYPLTLVACDKNGNKVTQEFSLYVKPQPAVAEKKPSVGSQQSANVDNARDYVLNSNPDRMRFHKPTCGDVKKISAKNRQDVHMTREEVIAMGYTPCGHCHP